MPTTRTADEARAGTEQLAGWRARLAEKLLDEEADRLRSIAYRQGARDCDLDDALQTAFVQFLASFDGPEELALPWLITTLKRAVWRQARTRRRRPQTSFVDLARDLAADDDADQLAGESIDPVELVVRTDEIARQRMALADLPREQQQALFLSALELSHEEIGQLTGWTPRQTRRYVQKGNATLADPGLVD